MGGDGDPQSPGPQPNPFENVRSAGSGSFGDAAIGPQPAEPLPEDFSAANGPSLPPVIEAFPGSQGGQQPPRKVGTTVVGSRVIRWPVGVGIGVAGIAVILVVAVITVLLTHRRAPNPGAPAAPPVTPPTLTTPEQLDGILLSVADISAVMGDSTMHDETNWILKELQLSGGVTLSHPDCLGAFFVVLNELYAGSGQTAVRSQFVSGDDRNGLSYHVNQAAVTFPSVAEASRFVQNSADKWKNCANQTVTETFVSGQPSKWTFASLNGKPPTITLNRVQVGASNNRGCQHALSAVSNVVIDVDACKWFITNEGGQIADKMAAKVKGQ